MTDIYNTPALLENAVSQLKSAPGIADADRAAFLAFLRDSESNGRSPRRVLKYANVLRYIAREFDGPVTEITEEKARTWVRKLEAKRLSAWTRLDYKAILRVFVRWYRRTDEYPPEVRWIRVHLRMSESKLPEDLIKPADVVAMANACDNLRDRALIAVLYESGMRIGELLNMTIGSVRPHPNGAELTFTGKTGGRRILIVQSAPALYSWLAVHHDARNLRAPLWVKLGYPGQGEQMTHVGVNSMLKRKAAKAGIRKRVHPHLFRHSRASELANRLTEAQMNAYFGWIQGSDMPRTYVHLSGRDVDAAILSLNGIRRADAPTEAESTMPACPRCGTTVHATALSCPRCWQPLMARPGGAEEAMPDVAQAQSLMSDLVKNPLFLQALAQVKAARSTPPGAAAPTQAA